jgi:hypothetical protein
VPLCTDSIFDPSETVNLTLSNPTNVSLGTQGTATFTISDSATFNGSINVGIGERYPSLTNAGGVFEAINNGTVAGNLTINITSDLAGETGANALNQISSGFPVTIKPSGAARTITGTSENLIKLNGADNITIDGSLNGGTDRSLTISNPTGSTAAYVVWLASVDATNGATFDTVKNCILVGHAPTTTFACLISSGSTLGGMAEAANSNNTFQNNAVTASQFGLTMVGPTGNETGNTVAGNLIGSTQPGSKIGFNGIAVFQQASATISNNIVQGVATSTDITAPSVTVAGIRVAGTADGISVNANDISNVRNFIGASKGAIGIELGSSVTTANITVVNNFIRDIDWNRGGIGRRIQNLFQLGEPGHGATT